LFTLKNFLSQVCTIPSSCNTRY